jgi:hypothetical protein
MAKRKNRKTMNYKVTYRKLKIEQLKGEVNSGASEGAGSSCSTSDINKHLSIFSFGNIKNNNVLTFTENSLSGLLYNQCCCVWVYSIYFIDYRNCRK